MGFLDDEIDDAAHMPQQRGREVDEEMSLSAGREVRHVDDGERQGAGGYNFCDRFAGRCVQRDVATWAAEYVKGETQPRTIRARCQPPPVRLDRVKDADARAL